ncbi:SDR family NAD(P)-dependent oxidoreductase [Ilumatobacter sp.]|uniref:SDR family NAD(P)-dependent oxidoreductase n=1 Tax=Ilumatobacter sp. TaxID=1967498 RepID=UPI003B5155BA
MEDAALDGQVALVTGGGSGIGLGCARALVDDGAAVVLAARRLDRLEDVAAQLRADHPGSAIVTVGCDVTDEASVAAACSTAAGLGRFSIVVANAGHGAANPFHRTTLEEWNGVLSVNLTGAFLTMKHAVGHLDNGGGSIVAVSSIAGVETHRYMTPYTVSKAGLEMLVRQVADELGPHGVRANAVRPGLVPTEATTGLMSVPAILEDYLSQMPLGRTGTVRDVAELVRFLAGPESSWITGTCIGVDGGHHLRRGPNIDAAMTMLFGDDVAPPHHDHGDRDGDGGDARTGDERTGDRDDRGDEEPSSGSPAPSVP